MVYYFYMKPRKFINGEFYHVYNRGTDHRSIFASQFDVKRFLQSLEEFNTTKPAGSLYAISFLESNVRLQRKKKRLVNIIAYCLNPNHFHLILQQVNKNGISEFLKRLTGGYAWYFNNKQKRSGVLFQGKFKAKHIDSNEYLLHLSAYVNLNNHVHKLSGPTAKLSVSSWDEYIGNTTTALCKKDIILEQFSDVEEFKEFAQNSLKDILERKERFKELQKLLLEEV